MLAYFRNSSIVCSHVIIDTNIKTKLSSLCAQEEYLKLMIKNIDVKDQTKTVQIPQKSEEPNPNLTKHKLRALNSTQPKICNGNLTDKIGKIVGPSSKCISPKDPTAFSESTDAQLKNKLSLKLNLNSSEACSVAFTGTQIEPWSSNHSTPVIPLKSLLNPSDSIVCSISSLRQWFRTLNLDVLEPLPQPATNLAAYLPNSYTLTQLAKLGVNLSKIEALPGVANMLIKMDFKTEIEPLLWLFSDLGFDLNQMARILTVFPKVLKLQLDDVKSRVAYFRNHGFSSVATVEIIHKQPLILQETSVQIDQQLGQIQNLFDFQGEDVRNIVIAEPKVVVHPISKIKDIYVILTKAMQFSTATCRNLVGSCPKLLTSERDRVSTNFVLMHSRLNLPTELIQLWPEALVVSPHLLFERSSFLVSRGLFQPDPKRPLYTPLGTVVSLRDEEFCQQFGRISEDEYDCFIRTL